MKKNQSQYLLLGLLLLAPIALVGAEKEREVSISEVPAAVKETILKHTDGAVIKEIEEETEDGKVIYSIEAARHGSTFEFEVGIDGSFLGFEDEDEDEDDSDDENEEEEEERSVTPDEVPDKVMEVVRKLAEEQEVDLTVESESGTVVYEAAYSIAGVAHETEISPDGEVLEIERSRTVEALPHAVLAAFQNLFPEGKIAEAEEIQVFYYELEVVVDGKRREVRFSPAGTLLSPAEKSDDATDEDND